MAEASRRASGVPSGPEIERQIGTLALSQIDGAGSLALMRAVAWQGILARLGYAVPLVVIHDLGCLIAGLGAGRGGWSSAVVIGPTRSGSSPRRRNTSRANSNQDTAPALVRWKVPGRRSTTNATSASARSAVKVG